MLKKHDFEQDYHSRIATGIYKIGNDSVRIMKRLAYFDRSFYGNFIYYVLMASILKFLNEIP